MSLSELSQGTYNLDCRPHADPYRISPAKEVTVDQASGGRIRIWHVAFLVDVEAVSKISYMMEGRLVFNWMGSLQRRKEKDSL